MQYYRKQYIRATLLGRADLTAEGDASSPVRHRVGLGCSKAQACDVGGAIRAKRREIHEVRPASHQTVDKDKPLRLPPPRLLPASPRGSQPGQQSTRTSRLVFLPKCVC